MFIGVIGDETTRLAQAFSTTVTESITAIERGRVHWQASYWFAELYQQTAAVTVLPGQRVRVIGRRGITLLVIPG